MSRATLKAIQAAAGNAGEAVYVDDVFSTYLYTGNAPSSNTITNEIDLSGEGGLVWIKGRTNAQSHGFFDTARGATKALSSDQTWAEYTYQGVNAFYSDGFRVGYQNEYNQSGLNYASWTFRKQPGFFDVVTYTGNGLNPHVINHNLGATPGMIIQKAVSRVGNWTVWHRSLATNHNMFLNSTSASSAGGYLHSVTDSSFTVNSDSELNQAGQTYIAYIFAHDAQDFGTNSDESIIKCGSYTGNGSSNGPTIDLGFEPQWLLLKRTDATQDWFLYDNMRGFTAVGANMTYLSPNLSSAEGTYAAYNVNPTANGFKLNTSGSSVNASGGTYIYVAIRRPHKPAEEFAATDLFAPTYLYQYDLEGNISSSNGMHGYLGNPTDFYIQGYLSGNSLNAVVRNRMTGSNYLISSSTSAETTGTVNFWDNNVGSGFETSASVNNTIITYNFRRAPGFFDVVTYTGTGSNMTIPHNLGVAPELFILRKRNLTRSWVVYSKSIDIDQYLTLNTNGAAATFALWQSTAPTATQFTVGTDGSVNGSGDTFVVYLFATVPGISKVDSYTGTGSDVNVNCGFTSGARFVLVKRTDSTGDWYVWDSVRGIVAGNDPYLLLNSSAAQVTSTDYIDPLSSGFTVTSTAPAGLNASGGTYIFLAIA